jgi:hypothetical protein
MKLGLSDFKKVHEDEHSAILKHPKGHHVVIAKKSLSPKLTDQLRKLPMYMAEGGDVREEIESPPEEQTPEQKVTAERLSQPLPKAEQLFQNATASGDFSVPTSSNISATPTTPAGEGIGYDVSSYQNKAQQSAQPQGPPPPAPLQLPPPPMGGAGAISGQAEKDINVANADIVKAAGLQETSAVEHAKAIAAEKQHYDTIKKDTLKDAEMALQDWKSGAVDRSRVWKNKDTSTKAMNIIALVMGAMGAAKVGGENLGVKALNKQIEDDVADQKDAIDQKKTIYSAYLDRYKDADAAYNAALGTQKLIYASKLDEAAGKMKSGEAKQNAAAAVAKLKLEAYDRMEQAGLRRAMMTAKPAETQEQRSLTVETPDGAKYKAYSPTDASKVRASVAGYRDLTKSLQDFRDSMSADINPFSAQSTKHAAQVADLHAKLKDPEHYNFGQLAGGDLDMMKAMLSSGGSWNKEKVLNQIDVLMASQKNKMQGMLASQLEGYQPRGDALTKRINVPAGYHANSRK